MYNQPTNPMGWDESWEINLNNVRLGWKNPLIWPMHTPICR